MFSHLSQFFSSFSTLAFIVNADEIITKLQREIATVTADKNTSKLHRENNLVSLQHGLQEGARLLKYTQEYDSKEMLIIYNSINTCDPGNILQTIDAVAKAKIRCNVISLDAEFHLLTRLTSATGGLLLRFVFHFRSLF